MFKKLILSIIKFYQRFFSPDRGIFGRWVGCSLFGLRKNCRFYPSCSEYTYQSIEKYGIRKGLWSGIKRILKCHPWHLGGVDLP